MSSLRGLTDAVDPLRNKGHDPRHLLDFELLTRPPQAFAEKRHRRHHGNRTPRISAARSAPCTAAATPAASARGRGAALPGRRGIELSLDQALRIIAVGCIEIPAAAEIHAGGRRLLELFARTSGKAHHGEYDDKTHAAILYGTRCSGYSARL